MIKRLEDLFDAVAAQDTKTIAVAAAEDDDIINIVKESLENRIARFIFLGDQDKIEGLMKKADLDASKVVIINEPSHTAAACTAVSMVRNGEADLVMKGNLHTSIFLKAVLDKETGVRSNMRISQISVYDKFSGEGFQMITDCAVNITPSLLEKKSIIENAVELAHRLGNECPKVALLSAVEVVNPEMQDTIDAAALSKMCDRNQIKGAVVDGPLALDNAVNEEAARHKGIKSKVAGHADILVAPNLLVGNNLLKSLMFFSYRKIAAVVAGTTKPVIMTSRTDTIENKLLSIAMTIYVYC